MRKRMKIRDKVWVLVCSEVRMWVSEQGLGLRLNEDEK